jgi:hypothetical protein
MVQRLYCGYANLNKLVVSKKGSTMLLPNEVQELIESSGNNFHAKVAQWFAKEGWSIQISPYYLDQTQQKAREIDLVAEKLFPYKKKWSQHEGHVIVRLYIECKFVPAHAVFWFSGKNKRKAESLVCSFEGFASNNSFTSNHHYLSQSSRVAKLFSSSKEKQQENDLFYKALNQILSAYVSFRHQQSYIEAAYEPPLYGSVISLTYPVVVCSSFQGMYAVDFLGQQPTTVQTDNFQMEVSYAYGDSASPRNEYFLVDFVSYEGLANFMAAINEDVEAAIDLNASN